MHASPVPFGPFGRLSLHWQFHLLLAVLVFFLLSPSIDIGAARLFFDPEEGFALAQHPVLSNLRMGVWRLTLVMAVLSLVMLLAHPFRRQAVLWPTRVWGFAVTLLLLGPGLLVNVILKTWWGRVRPPHLPEFGGNSAYTPPFQIDGDCLRNCSFVSGEGGGATALAVIVLVLGWAAPWRMARPLAVALAALIVLFGAGLRVVMGGHFLSDVVFSILMVWILAEILVRIFRLPELPGWRAS